MGRRTDDRKAEDRLDTILGLAAAVLSLLLTLSGTIIHDWHDDDEHEDSCVGQVQKEKEGYAFHEVITSSLGIAPAVVVGIYQIAHSLYTRCSGRWGTGTKKP